MQIHKDITPAFVTQFKCVGPACLMTCCQGWSIYIDKKTHHRYLTSGNSNITNIAKANLIRTQKGKDHYSVIKLDENRRCPFIDADKLCLIQHEMGEKALSKTCSSYPRLKEHDDDETRYSLTLSCPEVVRLVLFNENSMLLREETRLLAQSKKTITTPTDRISQLTQLIHLFSWNIIASPSLRIEENLMALAHFILYLQRIEFDVANRLDEVERYFAELITSLQSGTSLLDNSRKAASLALKVKALAAFGTLVAQDNSREGFMAQSHGVIAEFLNAAQQTDVKGFDEKFAHIDAQWHTLCTTGCLSAPYVLRNYLRYKLYNSYFPGHSLETILRQYYRIVMDFFYFKHLISARALTEQIDEQAVMKTLASFSEKIMHSQTLNARADAAIDMINGGDDLSCLLLLG